MLQRFHVPGRPLSDFVAGLWIFEGPAKPHPLERLLPTGTTELVISLHDTPSRIHDPLHLDRYRTVRGPIICGPHSSYFVVDTAVQVAVMGVHFKPGGALPFLGRSSDLQGTRLPLGDVWSGNAARLQARLIEARTADAKLRILEASLLAHAVRPLTRHPAVTYALREIERAPHTARISDITTRVGLSPRRFAQVFEEEVGLLPKLFGRIQRFQRVLQRVQCAPRIDWARAALEGGYYDQAHLIRDFRAFTGLAPTAWMRLRSDDLNHVPLAHTPSKTRHEVADD